MDTEEKPTVLVIGGDITPTGRYRTLVDALSRIHDVQVVYRGLDKQIVGANPDLVIQDFSHLEDRLMAYGRIIENKFRELPADHPTRKREPKGPRGRWGKL